MELHQKNLQLERVSGELKQSKSALTNKDNELFKMSSEIGQLKSQLSINVCRLGQKDRELEQAKAELEQRRSKISRLETEATRKSRELEIVKSELDKKNLELEQLKAKLDQCKEETEKLNRKKSKTKRIAQNVLVCGVDDSRSHVEKPNNEIPGAFFIYLPMSALADSSSLLSFSANCLHSVRVTHDGLLIGIGDNRDGRISNSLPSKKIEHLTKFSIDKGSSGLLTAVSAVCLSYGTFYMRADGRSKLVLCHEDVERVILDTGNKEPVALFGG